MTRFQGFPLAVRDWFEGLEADNSRAYFLARRDFYDSAVRGQLEALLTELTETFGGEVKVFRQNRDIRFSPDKSPYKTNTYGIILGADLARLGLYASISADGLVAGSGYYAMARDQLERYREAVADARHGPQLADHLDAARAAGLEVWGERLATAPRGYPSDHERIELLRYKSLTLVDRLRFGRGISRDGGLRLAADTWRAASSVTAWLDTHVGASALPAARAGGRR